VRVFFRVTDGDVERHISDAKCYDKVEYCDCVLKTFLQYIIC
jgi:hypothetical protein